MQFNWRIMIMEVRDNHKRLKASQCEFFRQRYNFFEHSSLWAEKN